MAFNFGILREEEVPTLAIRTREFVLDNIYEASAIARTLNLELPKDHFIHQIDLRMELGTLSGGSSPAWVASASDLILTNLKLSADGGKTFKDYKWKEAKEIAVANGDNFGYDATVNAPNYNRIYFSDPKIRHVRPLPSWIFTSLKLECQFQALSAVTTGSPTAGSGTKLVATIYESEWTGQKLAGDYPILVEVVSGRTSSGAGTGDKTHAQTRANTVFGYVLHADDNGTDSDTIFDWVKLVARKPEGTYEIVSKRSFAALKQMNKVSQLNVAHATGYANMAFPNGLVTKNFTSLDIIGTIDTAGTDAGLRVVERYSL